MKEKSTKKQKMPKARFIWAIAFSVLLTAYTTFAILDTFVIPQAAVSVSKANTINVASGGSASNSAAASGGSASNSGNAASGGSASNSAAAAIITENSYESDNIKITISETTYEDTQVYIADIYVSDPSKLMTGLANGTLGKNITQPTSDIAESCNAILAINGDYYGFRNKGYVMKNGYLYRTTKASGSDNEDLVIYEDGSMEIINESDVTAEELQKNGAVQIFSFGPGLIDDGVITVDSGDEVGRAKASNPRTAIGMIEEGHYVFVVSDGRSDESEGLTLSQLAKVMKALGCTTAYNLDGGGSSTMWFNGNVINNPTSTGNKVKERSVSDIVYIGK